MKDLKGFYFYIKVININIHHTEQITDNNK